VAAGATEPDWDLLVETLEAQVVRRPTPTEAQPQHLCLDAGYDLPIVWAQVRHFGYQPHIRSRAAEREERQQHPDAKPRRWVVEVAHSWLNRFRKLLVRFEELEEIYTGLLQFACAYLVLKRAGVFK